MEQAGGTLERRRRILFIAAVFAANFLGILLYYRRLIPMHYSIDTWAEIVAPEANRQTCYMDGRFLYALFRLAMEKMGLSVAVNQSLFTALYMVITAALLTFLLYKAVPAFAQGRKGRLWRLAVAAVFLALFLSVNNVFILEYYLFPECMMMYAGSVVGAALGGYAVSRGLSVRSVLLSFLFCFVCVSNYQIGIGMYVVWGMTFIFLEDRGTFSRKAGAQLAALLAIGAANSLLNPALVKMGASLGWWNPPSREASLSLQTMLQNAGEILQFQKELFVESYGFLSRSFLLVMVVLLALLFVGLCVLRKIGLRTAVLTVLYAALGYAAVYIPQLATESFWPSPRLMTPFFVWLSMAMMMVLYYYCAEDEVWVRCSAALAGEPGTMAQGGPEIAAQDAARWQSGGAAACGEAEREAQAERARLLNLLLTRRTVALVGIGGILVIGCACFLAGGSHCNEIIGDHLLSNRTDIAEAQAVGQEIWKYEQETGVTVTKFACAADAAPTNVAAGVDRHCYDINRRAWLISWAALPMVNTVNGLQLTAAEMPPEVFDAHFKDQNWDSFDVGRQLVIEGDTAYLAIYWRRSVP